MMLIEVDRYRAHHFLHGEKTAAAQHEARPTSVFPLVQNCMPDFTLGMT